MDSSESSMVASEKVSDGVLEDVSAGVPQTADAQKTRTVGEIVEEADSVIGDEEGWTTVGKSRSSSPSPKSPEKQLLQLTHEDVEPEINYWSTAVVCYVLGGNPPWELLSEFVNRLWGKYKYDKIAFLPNGAFLVHFPTLECKNLVLQQGFPMYDNKPLVVKPWTEDCSLAKERVKKVPIWIRLCGLALKFWGSSSLEKISSLVGKFMRCDGPTMDKTRLGYARIMVEVDVGQEFPERLFFKDEKGMEICVPVEYEWRPDVCSVCHGIGHVSGACQKKIETKAPAMKQVWRPVARKSMPVRNSPVVITSTLPVTAVSPRPSSSVQTPLTVVTTTIRQKHQATTEGGDPVSPSYAEVLTSPKKSVEGGLDNPPGNILNGYMSDQHITASITELSSGHVFLFTVVYGSNDEGERLNLWEDLKLIRDSCSGPWAVCGDFNNLLGLNERVGRPVHLSDIVDFRDCIDYCDLWKNQRMQRPHFSLSDNSIVVDILDVEKAVEVVKIRLHELQLQLHQDTCNLNLMQDESTAAEEYRVLAKAHHSFLSQKAKIRDKNGKVCSEPHLIEQAFLDYYHDLLGTSTTTLDVHFPSVKTGPLISDQHRDILMKPVSPDEIKNCIFSIPANKSPSPDGFTSRFYRDSWEIIGKDIIGAVMDFFSSGELLKQINTTTLTLIPKVKHLVSVLEYRPIVCCNVIYKCITKILCNRLGSILPDIINSSQGGFVKGRNIMDNVLICQDIVRMYNRKVVSPRCLIKIDLRKAYDSVEWKFLHQML
ncbi:uncharacterized protein LOC141601769 [Silene latifolia]|uniref:uncharacterized protein LOC141601769 n=1 Tax=Silene latifolia TaxID=37657 RepID=UPI003D76EACE